MNIVGSFFVKSSAPGRQAEDSLSKDSYFCAKEDAFRVLNIIDFFHQVIIVMETFL